MKQRALKIACKGLLEKVRVKVKGKGISVQGGRVRIGRDRVEPRFRVGRGTYFHTHVRYAV